MSCIQTDYHKANVTNPDYRNRWIFNIIGDAALGYLVVSEHEQEVRLSNHGIKRCLLSVLNGDPLGKLIAIPLDEKTVFKNRYLSGANNAILSLPKNPDENSKVTLIHGQDKIGGLLYAVFCPEKLVLKDTDYPIRYFANVSKAAANGGKWKPDFVECAFEKEGKLYFQKDDGDTDLSIKLSNRSKFMWNAQNSVNLMSLCFKLGIVPFGVLGSQKNLALWLIEGNDYLKAHHKQRGVLEKKQQVYQLFSKWLTYHTKFNVVSKG
jgi:hypothetical protein